MKARQEFVLHIDEKGNKIPWKGDLKKGIKELKIKKGDEVPKEFIKDLIVYNLDLLDVQFKEGRPVLPEEYVPTKAPEPIVKIKKHTQNKLTKVYNAGGQDALEKIAVEEFGITIPKYTRYGKIINWILEKQEEQGRK